MMDDTCHDCDAKNAEIERLSSMLNTMKSERDELARQVACLKVDIAGRSEITLIEQHEKKVALLQVDVLKKVLYAEVHGENCGPDCAGGGYRECMECEAKVRAALDGVPYKRCETRRHDVCNSPMEFAGGPGWVCPKCDPVTKKRVEESPCYCELVRAQGGSGICAFHAAKSHEPE